MESLAYSYLLMGEWHNAIKWAAEEDKKFGRVVSMATKLALLGYSYVRQGLQENAERLLIESLAHIHYHAKQIALNGLGELYLVQGRLNDARQYYERCLSVSKGRPYYVVQSTLGLLQVDIASLAFQGIVEKTQQIEEISVEHGYNDHLASLRLIQGHIVWDGPHTDPPPHAEEDRERALRFYQDALIYALRYNRFLLDEILSGRPQGTPLQPIILHCLERGEQGSYVLTSLRDWWQTGTNGIGTPQSDKILSIPADISLLEAERIARNRERGDGSPQKGVVEQINETLKMAKSG